MKPLPTSFTKNGFLHKQVLRQGDWAIFARHLPGFPPHFELIRVRTGLGHPRADDFGAEREVYPSSCDWGRHGFTDLTLADAEKRLSSVPLFTKAASEAPVPPSDTANRPRPALRPSL